VKVVKGFFEGAVGNVFEIHDDHYVVVVKGQEINKKKNEVKKL
jgi:ribosomal protein L24